MVAKNFYMPARAHRAAGFLSTTRFERDTLSTTIKLLISPLWNPVEKARGIPKVYFTEIAEANAFYPRYLNTREKENAQRRPRYSILQDDTKRERYLSSSSLSREAFIRHSGIRSNKHSAETDSRGDSRGTSTW